MAWARPKRSLSEAEIQALLNLDEDDLHELVDIQLQKMNMAPLVNKPYVNEVTLNEHNLYSKSC